MPVLLLRCMLPRCPPVKPNNPLALPSIQGSHKIGKMKTLYYVLAVLGTVRLPNVVQARKKVVPNFSNEPLTEDMRREEYHKRNYTWPIEKFRPDTEGWNKLWRERLAQVEELEGRVSIYDPSGCCRRCWVSIGKLAMSNVQLLDPALAIFQYRIIGTKDSCSRCVRHWWRLILRNMDLASPSALMICWLRYNRASTMACRPQDTRKRFQSLTGTGSNLFVDQI